MSAIEVRGPGWFVASAKPGALMPSIVYVADSSVEGFQWIRSALAGAAERFVSLDLAAVDPAEIDDAAGNCLIASADADPQAALQLVRTLRQAGRQLPLIVLGPHSAFRVAVEIARFDATDFLERPVSPRQLRAAVERARSPGG
jgi:DNA-binding NtrC family response regulator